MPIEGNTNAETSVAFLKLLRAKQHAILLRDNTFEEILLETCRLTDEKSIESNDLSLFESFGYIITYFDRFDTTLATVSQISFMEGTVVTEEKLRSLLGNKRAFDEISEQPDDVVADRRNRETFDSRLQPQLQSRALVHRAQQIAVLLLELHIDPGA